MNDHPRERRTAGEFEYDHVYRWFRIGEGCPDRTYSSWRCRKGDGTRERALGERGMEGACEDGADHSCWIVDSRSAQRMNTFDSSDWASCQLASLRRASLPFIHPLARSLSLLPAPSCLLAPRPSSCSGPSSPPWSVVPAPLHSSLTLHQFYGLLLFHLWNYDRFRCLRWSEAHRRPGAFKRVMTVRPFPPSSPTRSSIPVHLHRDAHPPRRLHRLFHHPQVQRRSAPVCLSSLPNALYRLSLPLD